MSPPPHREKDAKVEGRDPPEKAKGTMETFRTLTKRLLEVSLAEVEEQQALFEKERAERFNLPKKKKMSLSFAPVGGTKEHPESKRKLTKPTES